MADLEQRIRAKAEHLWKESGSPAGGPEAFRDRASELVAIEDNTDSTLQPNPLGEAALPEDSEPLEAVENLGDLPNLTDQGETEDYPKRRGSRPAEPVPPGPAAGTRGE